MWQFLCTIFIHWFIHLFTPSVPHHPHLNPLWRKRHFAECMTSWLQVDGVHADSWWRLRLHVATGAGRDQHRRSDVTRSWRHVGGQLTLPGQLLWSWHLPGRPVSVLGEWNCSGSCEVTDSPTNHISFFNFWAQTNFQFPEHDSDSSMNYILRFLTGLWWDVSFGQKLRQKRSRQHDPKYRLKSSQYTLIIPHRVIQLTTISFWVPETRLRLPLVNK